MTIKGWQGTTTLDYPHKIASIIFTGGCNLRCSYCHNMALVETPESFDTIPEDVILSKLDERKCFIDGVVISGGEPTIQNGLHDFLVQIKKRTGLKIKLDTNGLMPKVLTNMINEQVLDYIALDIKTSFENYRALLKTDGERVRSSINILRQSKVEYEFRATCSLEYINRKIIQEIADEVHSSETFFLQPEYRNGIIFSDKDEIKCYQEILKAKKIDAQIRGM